MRARRWLALVAVAASVLVIAGAGVFGWYTPRQMIYRPPHTIAVTPANVGLAYTDFTLELADEALSIAGWWMPAARPRAALLFLHGGGSSRNSEFFRSLDFYRALVEQGISVAAIDLRNHGNSGSDGRGLQFGRTEKIDALAALAWMRERSPDLPQFVMGVSMGGATALQALAAGAAVDGVILLDPALDTASVLAQAAWAETGLPPALFGLSTRVAIDGYGLPGGEQQALAIATRMRTPTLLIQDPEDPIALAGFARAVACDNPQISYLEVPPVSEAERAGLAWKGKWGSHVAAFSLYPDQVLESIEAFIEGAGATAQQ
ncbi:alpha/beta fold hydrolase [Mangrovimicrobium sediminis]|uniref:Alpha/beta fold hydrolase n=1 Tax=Mangrovimicrobium sediminis TaxID=2562682 RepID=A0A4Z0M6Z2_9GAMM|nr:alpha/beta fold hydrolase [Haliea sp. SAOS-164]TGD75176.1 alpha/beta fold hydrolase [Haliea sp. SAOS-164]